MIKRTLEISREPAHLTVRHKQLLLRRHGARETAGSVPCEDIGVVVVDHVATTYTHSALAALVANGATLVVCGADHLPAGVLLPLADHCQVVWRIRDQLAVGKPLQKNLWRSLVRAKIRGQAHNLPDGAAPRSKLLALARTIRSGDPTNVEAQAARVYWKHWLPDGPFTRDADGNGVNALLNYGYAILRAALARALVSAGLQPALGLHHHNRSNAFCLADDLVEPLRPLVDARVRGLAAENQTTLDQPTKAALLELLTIEVEGGEHRGPLMVALHRYVGSLVRSYESGRDQLEVPVPCNLAAIGVCGF